MKQENKPRPEDGAGPGSALPETHEGLPETYTPLEKIIEGARNDDQLQRLKDAAQHDDADTQTKSER
jgi:hypothetical protein